MPLPLKKINRLFLLFSLPLLFFLTACSVDVEKSFHTEPLTPDAENFVSTRIINPDSEIRGVWIASVYNIDYPSSASLSAEALKTELDAILAACEKNRLNTIFFQVRPECDALYESEIFPVSKYLSSDRTLTFDPLEYLVENARARNVYVYAWVNPLRVTVSGDDIEELPENSPARQNPDWVVPYADGKLYFNAGLAEVRQLVADGVTEIVKKYDVDGVVFDDYFYPYPVYDDDGVRIEFDDAEEYEYYGGLFDSIEDWRRDNINQIVRLCWNAVHEADPECVFGVAPAGVWQNDDGTNGGSDTRGFEAYKSLYCDALAWIEGGYVDYISPQIYWSFDSAGTPYDTVLRWWNAALEGTSVKLYVSHASYKYEDGNWDSPDGELTEQIEFARSERAYRGSVFYGYDEINRNINGASDDLLAAYKNEIIYSDIASNGQGVSISSPASGTVLSTNTTYLIGMSDPYYPLTLNGKKIGRTKSGYFSLSVSLDVGENIFTFVQNGVEYVHVIYYNVSSGSVETKSSVTVLDSLEIIGIYPSDRVTTSENELWVSCVAPYRARVTATVNGVSTELVLLEEPTTKTTGAGYIGAVFGKLLTLPEAEDGTVLDVGTITFTASLNGSSVSAEGCAVRVMGENAKIAVTVLNDYANLKFTETSSYYNDYTVQSVGMTDYIVSQRNGFYRLRMGGYIAETDVRETTDFPSDLTEIRETSVVLSEDGETTEIRIKCPDRPAYYGVVEDGRFVLTLYNIHAETAPEAEINPNPMTNDCEVIRLPDSNRVRYSFQLYDERNFYGFDLRYETGDDASESCVVVTLRNPKKLTGDATTPLSGITIVLDAGHGGQDGGAAGALPGFAEKDVNLAVTLAAAERLIALGANVVLTRAEDATLELSERTAMLEELEPDLCLSIHQNSMDYSVDITRVRGTLALYCMDGGRLLAECVGKAVAEETGRLYRGADYQMLAMCRNPKFPAALIEVGFMTSVEEYEQMTNGSGIEKAADGVVSGVLRYFEEQARYAANA